MKLKHTLTILLFTTLLTVTVLAEYPHAAPPQGDPSLTNRLGRSWSEPIYTGYLLVDGQYIEAPYIVEQRGYRTMVNGVQVERRDPRAVLPLPAPLPVTEDPGMPGDLTKNSTLGEALRHPITVAKRQYWDYIGLKGQKRLDLEKAYIASLPCVARVEDTGQPGVFDSRRVVIHGYSGEKELCMFFLSPMPSRVQLSDEALYKYSRNGRRYTENSLRGRSLIFVSNGSVGAEGFSPDSSPRWKKIFETMAGDLSPEEKLSKLKHLGFLNKIDSVRSANNFFSIDHFKPTEQLWKRLKEDESWKEGAEQRLYAITNSWKDIEPAFLRTNMTEIANTTIVKQRTPPPKTVPYSPAKPDMIASKPLASPDTAPPNIETKDIPRQSSATVIILAVSTMILIFSIIFIMKRRK